MSKLNRTNSQSVSKQISTQFNISTQAINDVFKSAFLKATEKNADKDTIVNYVNESIKSVLLELKTVCENEIKSAKGEGKN